MKWLPEYREEDKNIAMLFLNAEINAQLKPQHYLSYLIKVGYALDRFGAVDNAEKENDANNVVRFIDHVGLDGEICNAHVAKRLLTTFKVDSNIHRNPVFFGNIFVSVENRKKINNGNNMALLMSRVFYAKGGHYTFLSLFNLLGVLADISLLTSGSDDERQSVVLQEELQYALKGLDLIRDFHGYYGDAGGRSLNDGDDEQDDRSVRFGIDSPVIDDLIQWCNKAGNIRQYLSATDLANIWIRLSYNINVIDNRSENKKKNYAERLELYIVAVLNAFYVCCEEKRGNKIDISNPSTSPKHFYDKLDDDNYERDEEEWTFFDYLYECPIFKNKKEYLASMFKELENLIPDYNKTNQRKQKIDFMTLSLEQKKNVIRSISKHKTLSPDELRKEVMKEYKNVPKDLSNLL